MKLTVTLSLILLTVGYTAFGQGTPSGKTETNHTFGAEKGLIKASIMCPFAEGKTSGMLVCV